MCSKVTNSGAGTLPAWEGAAILLADLDAFFASVEQLDNPTWRGKPVIVGGDPDRRGVVSTCSYEARRYGVRSAMASSEARRRCPDAIWVRGRHERYRELSDMVMAVLRDCSPHVQQVSIDEAFVDVSPGRYIKGHPVMIAQGIQERVSTLGITCSIGLGTSKTVAKIASDRNKPNGLTVVYPGCERDFLDPLPVREISGVGRVAELRLHDLGITTIRDLASADELALKGVFGKNAPVMLARAHGLDASPVVDEGEAKSVSNEMTFSENIIELEQIRQIVSFIAAKVARRLRRKGLAGYTVSLKVRLDDLSFRTAQRTLPHAVDDEQQFVPVLHDLIKEVWRPGDELRLLGVGVSSFGSRPEQLRLFEDTTADVPPARALIEATDKVKDRFGDGAVRYGRELRFADRDTSTLSQNLD
ncbi:MAG: DNA polymerase IV [Coriobacteriales bacterium]|jgi:DNA polymerase-4|nr:DNA polymerase IV [Coriobacteriales bacterium]